MKCAQCERPAIVEVNNLLLCIDCAGKLQQLHRDAIHTQMRHINFLLGSAEHATGIPLNLPRYQVPQETSMILNHFNIKDSKIGVLNTGVVQQIGLIMENLRRDGQDELATALQELTQAVLDAEDLSPEVRNELVDQIAGVSEQAQLPPEQRKQGILRALMAGIKNTASTVGSLADTWAKVQPVIDSLS